MRAPSQYVCSLDNQRTEAPSGRVSRTWRLATSISVTSLEPTLKTYTVSRPSAPPAGAGWAGGLRPTAGRGGALIDEPPAGGKGTGAGPSPPFRSRRRGATWG